MKNRLEVIAKGMLDPINVYATSIIGALTFLWGVWIVLPLWDVFGRAPLYSRMGDFAPEWAWGCWATVCGATILVCLYKDNIKWLVWSFAFACWHWWTVSLFMWWGDWQNTGGLTYTFVAIYATFLYLNIKINHGIRFTLRS